MTQTFFAFISGGVEVKVKSLHMCVLYSVVFSRLTTRANYYSKRVKATPVLRAEYQIIIKLYNLTSHYNIHCSNLTQQRY